jgi:predicted DNA-binding protein (UPF0251 family)
MARPKKVKKVGFSPEVTYFKPRGVPLRFLEEVEITLDESEALRLVNIENLNQTDAAKKMNIHQSTLQRILKQASKKITTALIEGKAIKICENNYKNDI